MRERRLYLEFIPVDRGIYLDPTYQRIPKDLKKLLGFCRSLGGSIPLVFNMKAPCFLRFVCALDSIFSLDLLIVSDWEG